MNKVASVVKVGIADLKLVKSPNTIRTSGLGSCVGVIVYDLSNQIAGLAHIMLPESSLSKQSDLNPYKYADTAINSLISMILEQGAVKLYLKAKIAGGAQMFPNQLSNEVMRIGPRNVDAVLTHLHEYGIPVIASDVGGHNGRTIIFDPKTSDLKIRTVSKSEVVI